MDGVENLVMLLDSQKEKFTALRKKVQNLKFVPIDPGDQSSSIAFKSFDSGIFNLNFSPFEFHIVHVTDSHGNTKLNFASPGGDLEDDKRQRMISNLDANPTFKKFLDTLDVPSLSEVSSIPLDKETMMQLSEFACIFEKITNALPDDPVMIMKDGLLRTKKIKKNLIEILRKKILEKKHQIKVVGIAKASNIMFLINAALVCEKVFPFNQMGYVEIPLNLEKMAYTWSGHGKLDYTDDQPLDYAFGRLYVAKLARDNSMLVTIEIPHDFQNDKPTYTSNEIHGIMGNLAKDSMHSYPVLGYPKTIVKAHESIASLEIPSSMLREEILAKFMEQADPELSEYIRNSTFLEKTIKRGHLRG